MRHALLAGIGLLALGACSNASDEPAKTTPAEASAADAEAVQTTYTVMVSGTKIGESRVAVVVKLTE